MKTSVSWLGIGLVVAAALASTVRADQYVWSGYTGGSPGGSISNPYTNIQQALNVAASNDTIRIAAGTYAGGITVTNQGGQATNTGIRLLGGYSTDFSQRDFYTYATVISNAVGTGIVLTATANGCYLSGLRVIGCGGGVNGKGIAIWNAPKNYVIEDCIIQGNSNDGIYESDSNTTNSYIRRCLITGNGNYGLNTAGNMFTIINCTVVSNKYGATVNGSVWCNVRNCIIANSQSGPGLTGSGGVSTSSFNCVYGNPGGMYSGTIYNKQGDFSSDPQFASITDYHLKSTAGGYSGGIWVTNAISSPCIDAGALSDSVGSEPAPNGNRINLGCYGGTAQESKSPPEPRITTIDSAMTRNGKVRIAFIGADDNASANVTFVATGCQYAVVGGATTNWTQLAFVSTDSEHTAKSPMTFPSNYVAIIDSTGWVSGTNYQVTLQVNDNGGAGNDGPLTTSPTFYFGPARVKNFTQNYTYATPINQAISLATAGSVICLSSGVFNEAVTIDRGLTLQGGYNADFSAQDWTNWPTIITNSVGTGSAGAGITLKSTASGTVLLKGLRMIGCSGDGLYVENTSVNVVMFECESRGNGSKGIENGNNNTYWYVTNCLAVENKDWGFYGSGNAGTFVNCTFANNTNGGMCLSQSPSKNLWTIRNCILMQSTSAKTAVVAAASINAPYNLLYNQGGTPYSGSLTNMLGYVSADPRFVGNGDYHEQSKGGTWNGSGWTVYTNHSPAIDAGDTNSAYAIEPLPNGNRVNMGRYGNTLQASKSDVAPILSISYAYVRDNKVTVLFSGSDPGSSSNVTFVATNCQYAMLGGAVTNWNTLTFLTNDPDHTARSPMTFPGNFVGIVDSTGWLVGSNYQVRLQVNNNGGSGYNSAQVTSGMFPFGASRVRNVNAGHAYTLSINGVLGLASSGDTIGLCTGVYAEAISINQAITLQGGYSADFSSRDTTNWTTIITNSAGAGITLTTAIGGGSTVALKGLRVLGCSAQGIVAQNAGVTIVMNECECSRNAGRGIGNDFNNNNLWFLTNCLAADNGEWGFAAGGGTGVLWNCTFANNASGGVAVANTLAPFTIRNSIIVPGATNRPALQGGGFGFGGTNTWDSSFNDLYNPSGLVYVGSVSNKIGDISKNPLFVGAGDYHEQSKGGAWNGSGWTLCGQQSPCIDAGMTNAPYAREPTPNGGRVNLGAYGNTPQASLSYTTPPGAVILVR